MARVPKKLGCPLSREQSRGVLSASDAGTAYARVLRRQLVPRLMFGADCQHLGGLPGRGTDLGAHAVSSFSNGPDAAAVPQQLSSSTCALLSARLWSSW